MYKAVRNLAKSFSNLPSEREDIPTHGIYKVEVISGVNSDWVELSPSFQLQRTSQKRGKVSVLNLASIT